MYCFKLCQNNFPKIRTLRISSIEFNGHPNTAHFVSVHMSSCEIRLLYSNYIDTYKQIQPVTL